MNTFSMPVESEVGGAVRVHESVLCSIVRKAASAVPGVVRLAGASFVDNIAEIVGSGKRVFEKSIIVEMGDNSVQIEVRLVAAYGQHAPDIAANVHNAIIEAVTEMTGMEVAKLSILVMDFDDEATSDDEND